MMAPEQAQATQESLSGIYKLLLDPRMTFVVALYVMGMILKTMDGFPNNKVPITLVLTGTALGAWLFSELGYGKGALIGFCGAGLCVFSQQLISKTFPDSKFAAAIAGNFNFNKPDSPPVPVPRNSKVTIINQPPAAAPQQPPTVNVTVNPPTEPKP